MSIEDVEFTLKTVSSTRTAAVIGIIAAIGGPVATVQTVAEAAAASRRRTTFGLSR